MQVLFDLRPPHLIALQSQKVDLSRVMSVVLFLVFILLSIYNISFTTYRYFQVRQELSSSRGEQASVRDMTAQLMGAIREMQALKTRVVAYLDFTREELPAVEFMKVLEDTIPQGLKIASLEIYSGNPGSGYALMVGAALSDDEIKAFAANLDAMKYIVTRVDAPITTKSVLGSKQISDFRLTCDIRKILDIAADDPNQQQPVPEAPAAPAEGGGNQ
jgi:Tfp pilus assembly protein PilN